MLPCAVQASDCPGPAPHVVTWTAAPKVVAFMKARAPCGTEICASRITPAGSFMLNDACARPRGEVKPTPFAIGVTDDESLAVGGGVPRPPPPDAITIATSPAAIRA